MNENDQMIFSNGDSVILGKNLSPPLQKSNPDLPITSLRALPLLWELGH